MQKSVISLFNNYIGNADNEYWKNINIDFLEYHRLDMIFLHACTQSSYQTQYQEKLDDKKCSIEEKNSLYYQVAKQISDELRNREIPHVFLKGLSCIINIYSKPWHRYFGDIDILTDKKNINTIEEVLRKMGYTFGKMNDNTMTIVPATREDILFQKTFTHEMFNMVRKEASGWASNIDVNFLFSWNGVEQQSNNVRLSHLSNHIFYHCGIPLFDDVINFIHLCCHIYNEAVFFALDRDYLLGDPMEIKLNRVFDIALLSQRFNCNDLSEVVRVAKQLNCLDKVKFSIKVVTNLLGENAIIANSELLDNEDIDVNVYYDKNQNRLFWPISLTDRVYNLEKKFDAINLLQFC